MKRNKMLSDSYNKYGDKHPNRWVRIIAEQESERRSAKRANPLKYIGGKRGQRKRKMSKLTRVLRK